MINDHRRFCPDCRTIYPCDCIHYSCPPGAQHEGDCQELSRTEIGRTICGELTTLNQQEVKRDE